jgi:hypothetical protein
LNHLSCLNCIMEPTTGIEPVNLILTKDALYRLSYVGRFIRFNHSEPLKRFTLPYDGAGDGIRTRDPQLGRLTL